MGWLLEMTSSFENPSKIGQIFSENIDDLYLFLMISINVNILIFKISRKTKKLANLFIQRISSE